MRPLIALGFVLVLSAPAGAATPRPEAPRVTNLTSWHPRAWQPPALVLPAGAGLRVEPEQGVSALGAAELRAQADARREALANVPVRTRADGSRYAVIGGLVRAYTVATIAPDGRLVEECVHSEQQARQRIAASPANEK